MDQLKKIFYLLENYLKILACSQVSDRCPLGYLFLFFLKHTDCHFEVTISWQSEFASGSGELKIFSETITRMELTLGMHAFYRQVFPYLTVVQIIRLHMLKFFHIFQNRTQARTL